MRFEPGARRPATCAGTLTDLSKVSTGTVDIQATCLPQSRASTQKSWTAQIIGKHMLEAGKAGMLRAVKPCRAGRRPVEGNTVAGTRRGHRPYPRSLSAVPVRWTGRQDAGRQATRASGASRPAGSIAAAMARPAAAWQSRGQARRAGRGSEEEREGAAGRKRDRGRAREPVRQRGLRRGAPARRGWSRRDPWPGTWRRRRRPRPCARVPRWPRPTARSGSPPAATSGGHRP